MVKSKPSSSSHPKYSTPKVVFKVAKKHRPNKNRNNKKNIEKQFCYKSLPRSLGGQFQKHTVQEEKEESDGSLTKSPFSSSHLSAKRLEVEDGGSDDTGFSQEEKIPPENQKFTGPNCKLLSPGSMPSFSKVFWEQAAAKMYEEHHRITNNGKSTDCSVVLRRLEDTVLNSPLLEEKHGSSTPNANKCPDEIKIITNRGKDPIDNITLIDSNQEEDINKDPVVNTEIMNGKESLMGKHQSLNNCNLTPIHQSDKTGVDEAPNTTKFDDNREASTVLTPPTVKSGKGNNTVSGRQNDKTIIRSSITTKNQENRTIKTHFINKKENNNKTICSNLNKINETAITSSKTNIDEQESIMHIPSPVNNIKQISIKQTDQANPAKRKEGNMISLTTPNATETVNSNLGITEPISLANLNYKNKTDIRPSKTNQDIKKTIITSPVNNIEAVSIMQNEKSNTDKIQEEYMVKTSDVSETVNSNQPTFGHQHEMRCVEKKDMDTKNLKHITICNDFSGLGLCTSRKRKLTKKDIFRAKKLKPPGNSIYLNTSQLSNEKLNLEIDHSKEKTRNKAIKGYEILVQNNRSDINVEIKTNPSNDTFNTINDPEAHIKSKNNPDRAPMTNQNACQTAYQFEPRENYKPCAVDFTFLRPESTVPVQQKINRPQEIAMNGYDDDDDTQSIKSEISIHPNEDLVAEVESILKTPRQKFAKVMKPLQKKSFGYQNLQKKDFLQNTHLRTTVVNDKSQITRQQSNNKVIINNFTGHKAPSTSRNNQDYFEKTPHFEVSKKNELSGTPLENYCIDYLRMSTEKGLGHHCNYKHEVPSLENCTISANQINETIERIIEVNFNNPPKMFLENVVNVCVAKKHFPIVTKIAENFYADEEKLKTYFELIISSTKSSIKFHNDCAHALDSIFGDIFRNTDRMNNFDEVLNLLLDTLGNTFERGMHKLPLLHCVEFLKSYVHINYPATFKLAVIKQLMEKVDNKGVAAKKFAIKVYFTFFKNKKYDDLYQLDKLLLDRFIEYLSTVFKIRLRIQDHDSTDRNVRNYNSSEHLSNQFNSNGLRVKSYKEETTNAHITELIDTAINQPENETCVNLLLRRLGEPDCTYYPLMIFKQFNQNGEKGVRSFIRILKNRSCTNFVKKKLNNVTMSFLFESEKNHDWNTCYSLYSELRDFDPYTIRGFLNEDKTPVLCVLLIIRACLKTQKLREGIKLYFKYELYEEQRTLTASEADKAVLETVRCDIQEALKSNSHLPFIRDLLINLIDKQDSLNQPIDLTDCISDFITNMTAGCQNGEQDKYVTPVIDTILKRYETRKELMVEQRFHWRFLTIALVNAGKYDLARTIFSRAERLASSYFPGRNRDKVELATFLTKQEIFIMMDLIFTQWSLNRDSTPNLEIKFKMMEDSSHHPIIGDLNKTIPESKKRFKSALGELGLGLSLLHIKEDKDQFILDGIVLTECIKHRDQGTLQRRISPAHARYTQYGAYETSTNQGNYQS